MSVLIVAVGVLFMQLLNVGIYGENVGLVWPYYQKEALDCISFIAS